MKNVILIGWNPSAVDYAKWPQLTPEKLHAVFDRDRTTLESEGYTVTLGLIDSADTASDRVVGWLKEGAFDCVLIGAGVRTDPEHFRVFEQLVNAVHQHAPLARICFNTGPSDSVEAVKRWSSEA